jgi:hypothetical protein
MDNVLTVLSGTLLVCQLAWLRCRRDSYDRWRHHFTLVQTVRWLLLRYLVGVRRTGLTHVLSANVLDTAAAAPSRRLQKFISVTLLGAVFILFGSLVHMLPWRFQWIAVLIGTFIQIWGGCSQQLRLMHAAGLKPMAQQACYRINQLLLMPMTPPQQQHLCHSYSPAMVALFASLLVACVLPLWVSYQVEAASKRRCLRLQARQPALAGRDVQRLSRFDQVLVGLLAAWLAAGVPCYAAILFAVPVSRSGRI